MYLDLHDVAAARLDADVAIVGAGAAGITLCRRLLAGGLSVILLESGGCDYDADSAALNRGANIGQDYYALEDTRLRFFGGSTAIWGGRCAMLDPIDFERRAWVPHSGWPFGLDELMPYYREARLNLGLPEIAPTAADIGGILPAFDANRLVSPLWLFDGMSDRFSFARSQDLVTHPRCKVVGHATVRDLVLNASGRAIERLAVCDPGGRTIDVRARQIVLAAGGIENPRLLLASNGVMPRGIGNQHDQVGRFFMEHPHARGGRIAGAAWTWLRAFAKRTVDGAAIAPVIAPSPRLQADRGLLNTSLTVAGRRGPNASQPLLLAAYHRIRHSAAPTRTGRSLWWTAKRAVQALQGVTDPLRPWLLNKAGMLDVALVVRAEQAPNPDSRVLLSTEPDATGMPRVMLDWRTSALDVDSVAGLVDALGEEAGRLGLGTVEPAGWLRDEAKEWVTDALISSHPIGGYHHIGTTRMSDDPRSGVTDRDGRVHGVDNLYVAGSSLFPTSGWANPTLTIIALALRTGDRILATMGRPVANDVDAGEAGAPVRLRRRVAR
ncbi:MAG: FAD-dependent oxidoreductase [Sphingobium sp.]